jgi:hypothetical protein
MENLEKRFAEFPYVVRSWRPFYAETVYQSLLTVAQLFGDESIERATMGDAPDADGMIRAASARSQVQAAIEGVCDAIRCWLRDLVVIDNSAVPSAGPVVTVRAE